MEMFLMFSIVLMGDKSMGKMVYIFFGIKRKKYILFFCSYKLLIYVVYYCVLFYIYFVCVFFEYMFLLY